MDDTPPRNRLIALYTALAVVTLLALKPVFDAYYDRMHTAAAAQVLEIGQDLAPLEQVRSEWAGRDEAIERGMQQLAERGRLGVPAIAPSSAGEMNLDPLRGWGQLPREVRLPSPPPAPAPPPEPEAPAPEEAAPQQAAPEAAAPEAAAPEAAAAPRPARPARPAANPERPRPARARAAGDDTAAGDAE